MIYIKKCAANDETDGNTRLTVKTKQITGLARNYCHSCNSLILVGYSVHLKSFLLSRRRIYYYFPSESFSSIITNTTLVHTTIKDNRAYRCRLRPPTRMPDSPQSRLPAVLPRIQNRGNQIRFPPTSFQPKWSQMVPILRLPRRCGGVRRLVH